MTDQRVRYGRMRRKMHLYGHTEISEGTFVQIFGENQYGYQCHWEQGDWDFIASKDDVEILKDDA